MANIMVVEDDPDLISLLRTLLELEGHQVTEFKGTNQEALILRVCYEQPDILLMDVNLHGMNGLNLLRALRTGTDKSPVRIIMTSGASLENECLAAGADAFLQKPYMPDELFDLVENQLAPGKPSQAGN